MADSEDTSLPHFAADENIWSLGGQAHLVVQQPAAQNVSLALEHIHRILPKSWLSRAPLNSQGLYCDAAKVGYDGLLYIHT